jgi:signal peptidase II
VNDPAPQPGHDSAAAPTLTPPAGPTPGAPHTDAPPAPLERESWRDTRAWAVLLSVMLFSVFADLGSKWLAFKYVAGQPVVIDYELVMAKSAIDPRLIGSLIEAHEPRHVIPGILDLTLVLNPGAVFGIGPGQRWFFIVFTGLALGFGVWMFGRWTRRRDHSAHIAIGLLLGGGLGNLYDRLALGCVRDFLHPLPGLRFPFGWQPLGNNGEIWPYVSNIADLFLLVGIGMLLLTMSRRDSHRRARRHA